MTIAKEFFEMLQNGSEHELLYTVFALITLIN
jgi:hypothetical protein